MVEICHCGILSCATLDFPVGNNFENRQKHQKRRSAWVSVKPGTPQGHPIIPQKTLKTARNTPRTPKIVVSGQTAHELRPPKIPNSS